MLPSDERCVRICCSLMMMMMMMMELWGLYRCFTLCFICVVCINIGNGFYYNIFIYISSSIIYLIHFFCLYVYGLFLFLWVFLESLYDLRVGDLVATLLSVDFIRKKPTEIEKTIKMIFSISVGFPDEVHDREGDDETAQAVADEASSANTTWYCKCKEKNYIWFSLVF